VRRRRPVAKRQEPDPLHCTSFLSTRKHALRLQRVTTHALARPSRTASIWASSSRRLRGGRGCRPMCRSAQRGSRNAQAFGLRGDCDAGLAGALAGASTFAEGYGGQESPRATLNRKTTSRQSKCASRPGRRDSRLASDETSAHRRAPPPPDTGSAPDPR
jgi:hypothetical protein